MNIVTVLCAVSAMPTFTGIPEFAISVAKRWPIPESQERIAKSKGLLRRAADLLRRFRHNVKLTHSPRAAAGPK